MCGMLVPFKAQKIQPVVAGKGGVWNYPAKNLPRFITVHHDNSVFLTMVNHGKTWLIFCWVSIVHEIFCLPALKQRFIHVDGTF